MPKIVKIFLVSLLVVVSVVFLNSDKLGSIKAQSGACDATVYPSSYQDGANTHVITVNNTGSETIKWIQVVRPDDRVNIDSASSNGFSVDYSASNVILSQGSLSSSSVVDITVNTTMSGLSGDQTWGVNASINEDGSSYFNGSCR